MLHTPPRGDADLVVMNPATQPEPCAAQAGLFSVDSRLHFCYMTLSSPY